MKGIGPLSTIHVLSAIIGVSIGVRVGVMQHNKKPKVVNAVHNVYASLIDTNSSNSVTPTASTQKNTTENTNTTTPDPNVNSTDTKEKDNNATEIDDKSINPKCIGEIIKPFSIESKTFTIHGGGAGVENSGKWISNASDIDTNLETFLTIKFEMNSQIYSYINDLGQNMTATINLKMSPDLKDFGYSCPKNTVSVVDGEFSNVETLLTEKLKFFSGVFNKETNRVDIDITKLIRDKFLGVGDSGENVLNLAVKSGNKCIYRIHFKENPPTIKIIPKNTTYIQTDKWTACSKECKKEGAYQCAPIKCIEGNEKCDTTKMFSKRECVDVEDCVNVEEHINTKNSIGGWDLNLSNIFLKSPLYIGLCVALVILLAIAGIVVFQKMKGQKYVQITDEEIVGSVFTGGCI